MKIKITIDGVSREVFLKEIFWNAYQSAKTVGMGMLQENPSADRDDVFNNVLNDGDYSANINEPLYADYVFGRCLKLGFRLDDSDKDSFFARVQDYRTSYQTFVGSYPDLESLLDSVVKSLNENQGKTVTYEITRS